ncbi:lysyl-tRNA synthetase (plasmid) [Legionella adelaidensis]|uniref:Lysyl-tRNA synthetase n=1 Tax=Legionella adelaidensis TaxID=45056 RepID=A0A0W0R3B3_9GAMM|nr:elongation factor P--(R)-beta-lysine ligase [Legionella adelaidensis]KTC65531.1 lysyl-tRNA synthetase [Legionella adelaidensis]VEH84648.1 lysyl-tRNA synthetase [Legionella adelaidensis]
MQRMPWQPSASLENLKLRSQILANIRNFFGLRDYLEVETPIMARYGITDAYLANIKATFRHATYYLQTSPEYHMKRLLAQGSGPIFQIARVFRDDEYGRWHNPEFTLLEWYQLGVDHLTLLQEVEALLQEILKCPPLLTMTYSQAFEEIAGFNPFSATIPALKNILKKYNLDTVLHEDEQEIDQYLFLLMSHVIEPAFDEHHQPIALIDFPSSQASLAKIENGVAQRFEVYFKGIELANGFYELSDAESQRVRFENDNALRRQKGLEPMTPDEYLLNALEHGLPTCSGVALGLDRLIAIALQAQGISEVISFNFERA